MKFRFLALLALVLGMASCQKDTYGLDVDANGEAAVTISVALPDVETRAGGNDSAIGAFGNVDFTKYDVRYILEVYNLEGQLKDQLAKERIVNTEDEAKETSFTLRLIPGRGYRFVVWADLVLEDTEADLHYVTTDTDLKNIQLKNLLWKLSDETRDAYTGIWDEATFNSTSNIRIELKRPLGKLRVVTTDIKDMFNVLPEEVTVEYTSDFYTKFNAFTSQVVSDSKATINNTINAKTIKISENEYTNEWNAGKVKENLTLFADYYFAADEQEPISFILKVKDNNGMDIPQVVFNTPIPIQRNYLTTVMGPVLTDANSITVVVNDAFANPPQEDPGKWNPEEDEYDVTVWDGQSTNEPAYDPATKTYTIKNGNELAWLAAAVNGTLETRATAAPRTFQGETFKLTRDINLNFNEWTPIGNSKNPFQGTFDGQGHTIANLLITGNKSDVGLFGLTTVGEIKNLVVENAKVSGYLNVAVVAGTPYTSKYSNITVKGHVEVNGFSYVGGVGGKNAYANWNNVTVNVDETSYVNANSIEGSKAFRTYVGGVTGFNGEGGHSFTNITSNIDVKGSTCDVGGLFGIAHYGNKFENCSCSGDVEIYATEDAVDAQEIGGIAGVWHNQNDTTVTMTNCSFTGKLKTNIADVDFYYGGLVGKPYSKTGTGILWLNGNKCLANGIIEDENGNLVVNSLDSLEEALKTAGAAGAGDTTIVFAENTNINMTNAEWTPIKVDGYNGADIVTIEGNGAVITGLKAPLFAGGFAGGSGIVIKDLTIKDSDIVSANTLGSGAFIESIDSMDKIELTNCHLLDSTVTGGAGSRTGGLIGWTAGYNNQNDGPVKTYVTIDNCSVIGCTIQCDGSVGGINGHAGNNAWTYTTIKNCTIQNNILNSTDDGEWRTGVVVGTANVGEVTISNITESGNTLTQTGKTAPEGYLRNYYGRAVLGTTGKLTIEGNEYVAEGLFEDANGNAVVGNQTALEAALENGGTVVLAEGTYVVPAAAQGKTVKFIGAGDPEDTQVAVTKVGSGGENCDYGLDGSTATFENITITTNSSTYIGYARCNGTYKNCIINGTYTLYGNSVFEDCTFNVSGDVYNIWTWGAPTATFTRCTFNCDGKAMLLYGTVNTKLTMNNCVFNDKGGLADLKAAIEIGNDYGTSYELTVNNATVNGFEINDKGINTGTTLWANKNSMGQDKLNVVVDGVDVY